GDAGEGRDHRHGTGRRRVPAVVRTALGRDRGGRLDLVLDSLLYRIYRAGPGGVPDQPAAAPAPPRSAATGCLGAGRQDEGGRVPLAAEAARRFVGEPRLP